MFDLAKVLSNETQNKRFGKDLVVFQFGPGVINL
jgi:hypothetical protein